MKMIWIGLLIIGVVIVLSFVWRGPVQPSEEPGVSGVPGEGAESVGAGTPAHKRSQVIVPAVLLGLGGLASLPMLLVAALVDETGHYVASFGMLGFALLGLVGAAFPMGHKAGFVWLMACLLGQGLAYLGFLALTDLEPA